MKKLLITYNVIFFLIGNVLISNIHESFDHDHDHDHHHVHGYSDCQECVIIDSSNYILDFDEVNFSNNNTNLFVAKYVSVIKFNVEKTYLSRAPPIL